MYYLTRLILLYFNLLPFYFPILLYLLNTLSLWQLYNGAPSAYHIFYSYYLSDVHKTEGECYEVNKHNMII